MMLSGTPVCDPPTPNAWRNGLGIAGPSTIPAAVRLVFTRFHAVAWLQWKSRRENVPSARPHHRARPDTHRRRGSISQVGRVAVHRHGHRFVAATEIVAR